MGASCHLDHHHGHDHGTQNATKLALWIALILNGGMFVVELGAGMMAGSTALLADSADFLGDAANYGIALIVLPLALAWRARAAMLKGVTMGLFGLWVTYETINHILHGTVPEPATMGVVGVAALIVNVAVALMLFRFRSGDSNMRAVWICSRNDALGSGVFATGTPWPDITVATLMAGLALWGSAQVIASARADLRQVHAPA
jgi:Co/Zn/Cd efflux system component